MRMDSGLLSEAEWELLEHRRTCGLSGTAGSDPAAAARSVSVRWAADPLQSIGDERAARMQAQISAAAQPMPVQPTRMFVIMIANR